MSFHAAALLITFSVIEGLAMLVTLFRLAFRLKIGRFWWEDMWAAVVFVCGTAFIISQLVYLKSTSYETEVIAFWITSCTFTSAVWAVRMSLLYSIIRIISPFSILRKVATVIAFLFSLCWVVLVALKIWWCEDRTKSVFLFGKSRQNCPLPPQITLLEAITDWISIAVLVVLSVKLFWRIRLPRRQRRMILALFSSASITSLFSLFHVISQLFPSLNVRFIAFELEMAISLIVCDLLVVVTYIYRVMRSSPDGSLPSDSKSSSDDDDFTTRIRSTLTTVELDILDTTPEVTDGNVTDDTPFPSYHNSGSCPVTEKA